MASSYNLNYSASKYTNNSGMKQTYSFPSYYESIQSNDDLKAKNWNLNQMRMNQSLKEFMKSMNTNNKSTTDTNLDITNLDEDESIKPAGRYSNDDLNENTLNSNSTTAEFRKYLEDLKKNYLEKLTFSCPSKLVQSASSSFDRVATTNNNNVDMKLKSVENINNLIARKVSATPVTSFNSNSINNININQARRSLFFDKKSNHEDIDLPINEKLDEEIKTEKMFETPELTKTQILSRLVQIREYLKQSYSMLSTLQTSNDLMNYASQMNKLHSLIDHLKDQEKGYLDLLNSFSKFQQLTTNIFPVDSETNINQSSKDILDLTDLNESVQKQQKIQQQQQNKILKEHASYLNNLSNSSSSSSNSNKSVAVQTCLNTNKNNISLISNSNKMSKHENEDSIANSLSGSFISDTLTLNGINSEINNPTKYNKLSKNKLLDFENLVVIGKGYNKIEDDDNKTENDLDLLEYEDEHAHNDEKEVADLDRSSSIREQRREIMNALDSDLITLEQLKEQKKLLKSIRLRKEELKALEGRRKALEALQQIASESENKIDNVFAKIGNKSNDINSESDTNQESENKSVNKQHLMRKTFKHSNNNIQKDEHFASIEPSSQIEKSKKTVKHYEDLIKMKNSNEISLLKTCSPSAYSNSFMNDDKKNNQDLTENEQELIVKQELNKKMIDLAQNEKKLEELYSMQNKLAQLKEIIFDFNGFKQPQNELKSIKNDYSQNNDDEEVEVEQEEEEEEDLNEHGYNYEITQKYFNLLAKNDDADDDMEQEEEEEIDQVNQLIPDYTEDEDEKELNTANREQLKEHKTKLASAKEKLKQLQDLISKLKNVSTSKSSEANLTPNKVDQKETSAALEILNEIDKQKQQDRLDELKQNKQKLIELLKQKENESAELARLYTSHHSSQKELNISTSKSNDYNHIVYPPNEFESAGDDNDLELILKTSENQLQQQQTSFHHSPSDLLWNQMKKQLNMRENLRSKKKELEDLIRDENNLDSNRTEKLKTDQNDNHNDDNKIINGYRDFFLQNKSNSKYSSLNRSNPNEEQEFSSSSSSSSSSDTEDEEEIIMKRYVPNSNSLPKSSELFKIEKKPQQLTQQQNICSTDELIKENYESNDFDFSNQNNNDDDEEEEFNSTMKNAVSKKNDDETEKNNFLNSLSVKFNDLILNQQQLNESIQKNFSQLLDKSNNNNNEETNNTKPPVSSSSTSSNAYLMNSQFQYQTQMQVQQLMFNLNAAYHEIATQRSEMSNLNEQMKTINARLNELTSNKVTTGTNTYDDSTTNRVELKNEHHSSSTLMTTTNALPSYFYNRKQHGTNMEQQNKTSSNLYNRLNSLNDTDCIKKQFKSYQISNDQRSKQLSYLSKLEEPNSNNKLLTQQSSINYYTDDFEDCDEDNEEEKKQQKNRSRSSSNASSTKTNRSVDNTSNTNISIRSNSSSSSNLALKQKTKKSSTTPFWVVEKTAAAAANESNEGLYTNNDNGCSSMTASQPQTIVHDGELFSFDKMREKIYSEVAALISQNEARPFFLLNLFRELQYLKDKNARDQALKSIFNINNRNQQFIKKDNEMTMRPKQKQQNIQTDLIPNNEQDDFISYKYRMTKSEHIYKETDSFKQSNSSKTNDDADTSRTQSPFESDSLSNTVIFVRNSPNGKQPLKIKYPSKKNESDLQHKYQKNNDIDIDFSRSSSSSIMGIQESTNHSQNMRQMQAFDKFIIDQNKIENEVKNFISKIIKSIKVSDDNITDCEEEEEEEEDNDELESNEDEDDDYISLDEEILNNAKPLSTTISKQSSSKNSYKFARCDSDYLNEIIDKVLNVLKQSSDHHDYLRLYQQQLTSYLKEALNKYENKRLIKCMEDILIDISDILYNELTFYSIMNHTNTSYSEKVRNKFQQQIKMSRLVSKNIDIPSENNKFMTTKNVQTMDKSNGGDNLNLNLIKSLVRKNNQKANFNREEEEDGDSSVASFQSKSNINTISSSNNMSRTTSSEQTSKSTSRTNSADSTPALSNNDDTIYYFDENAVKTKLNCFKSNHKSDLTSKLESNYSEILNRLKFILNEKSEELTSLMKTSQTSEKLLLVNNDDDTKEEEINENEIKIEDLPDKLNIAREVALSTLDSIIMESISDGLVGDPNNLPLPQPTHAPIVTNTDINEPLAHIEPIINSTNNEKNSEDEYELQHSNRSSSSKSSGNSDQFIMISETSNISSDQDQDQVLVDEIKKSDEETQSVNMLENITITELNEAN